MKLRAAALFILIGTGALFMQACSRPLPPQASCNFVQSPELQRVAWKNKLPIRLYLHSSVPVEAYPAFDRAIQEFNAKLGHGQEALRIIARGVSGDLNPTKDGYSTIYWLKTWDAHRLNEQARTTIYWMGNEIFEADMRINAGSFQYAFGETISSSEVDLVSLVVHELGHVMGLAHNPTTGSVMNFSLSEGQERRVLGAVDMASLKCEY